MTALTPAPAGLDELDALHAAATPGPWKNAEPMSRLITGAGVEGRGIVRSDVVGQCDRTSDADVIVALRNRAPAMLAAIRAAYALHVPVELFEEVEPGAEVFDPTKPLRPFCRECTDDEYVETVEGGYAIDQGSPVIAWPCPTVTALDEALGVAK